MTPPDVLSIPTPPGPHPAQTNCVVLRDGAAVDLVDPGWDDPAALSALDAGLAELGLRLEDVRSIVATHWHVDHLSLAARIRERSGARILLGRPDAGEAGIPIDGLLDDGQELRLGGRTARVVATPGHTPGSICLDLGDVLLTGDTVLPAINPGLGLSVEVAGNPIRDYLASLDRIAREFAGRPALPGHGLAIDDLPTRCAELAAHHRARTAQVAAALAERPDATAEEIAPLLGWTGGWASLTDVTRMSALRQTAWHLELVGA
ncbi:MBL fold metallo-hydrolase [Pseudolysinimonas sp.]|uniref:MBL fold metallo-hydrolase n=1 Tax=Pseudolysinimonas sp. TaxID=2680009 RepID=UPI003F7EE1F2